MQVIDRGEILVFSILLDFRENPIFPDARVLGWIHSKSSEKA